MAMCFSAKEGRHVYRTKVAPSCDENEEDKDDSENDRARNKNL